MNPASRGVRNAFRHATTNLNSPVTLDARGPGRFFSGGSDNSAPTTSFSLRSSAPLAPAQVDELP